MLLLVAAPSVSHHKTVAKQTELQQNKWMKGFNFSIADLFDRSDGDNKILFVGGQSF